MNKTLPALLFSTVLLAGCGPDAVVRDLPSPGGKYHAQVRHCPENGAINWSEQLEVYVLEAGVESRCHSYVEPLVGLTVRPPQTPLDQLQVEWLTDTRFRVWYPSLKPNVRPDGMYLKQDSPIEVVFLPKP
ncbi:hypothetical protein [Pseudomonas syringae]|nr:hypothetical protein [Pseudomonas syringae]